MFRDDISCKNDKPTFINKHRKVVILMKFINHILVVVEINGVNIKARRYSQSMIISVQEVIRRVSE